MMAQCLGRFVTLDNHDWRMMKSSIAIYTRPVETIPHDNHLRSKSSTHLMKYWYATGIHGKTNLVFHVEPERKALMDIREYIFIRPSR